ncbi:cytochrome b/b6 domain-containing protein [Cereibacter sphaeroides]|uniref:cytochrome b n=1 Tax=Cereibacter sphaeroides TaxID=1063 RepID=UPI001F1886D5|nr:cytochrome b/b6 domain-containing protein [Cereibacter sphaeroides]MCE6960178.1 cytochrome b/b6 domain-containing protein [Cereibacter sphaeroides]MCE6974789.1 cytochrome b/b6 domain-containing protein [Cereibacter sphaeroides]
MTKEAPTGYSRMQIVLHWAVAVLVVVQFLLGPAMSAVADGLSKGEAVGVSPLAWAHVAVGLAILVLACWRVGLRFAHGVPTPAFEPKTPEQEFLAFVTRELTFFLYLTIFVLPISGAVAWFYQSEVAASAHASMKVLVIAIVAIHVAISLFHQFVLRDGALQRMGRPQRD